MSYPLLLHAKHQGANVVYQPFGSWIVPWRFDSLEPEYRALRERVGLIDYSTQALIQVEGTDRVSFLHNLLSQDIKRLQSGQGCQAALLQSNAKLIAELVVLADPTSLWLLCDATRADTVVQTLERYHFSEQITMTNHERHFAVLALQGPRAIACATALLDTVVSLPNAGDHAVISWNHSTLRLICHPLTNGLGLLCLIEAERAQELWERFKQFGASCGLQLVGWEALNTARIEAGVPWYGIDMDESNLLPETGLETLLASDTKGCYVGQEIVARLQTYGSVNKKLMGLRIAGAQVPKAGDQIMRAEEEVGRITSACHSPALHQPIALGYLKRGAYEPNTAVEIVHDGARLPATVTTR